MEGIIKLKTSKLISLSEQQLVDCDVGNKGCEGGLMDTAFKYIKQNGGLTSEDNYPYQGVDGTCNSEKEASIAAEITGYEDVPQNNENALLQAVAKQPVSVAVDGGGHDFQFYKSGVFKGDCGTNLNHAVTAIGYGTDSDGTDYWLVKNSWGTSWGESGYMRMRRGIGSSEGLCGVAMDASYPTGRREAETRWRTSGRYFLPPILFPSPSVSNPLLSCSFSLSLLLLHSWPPLFL